jgi:hypothetical protein
MYAHLIVPGRRPFDLPQLEGLRQAISLAHNGFHEIASGMRGLSSGTLDCLVNRFHSLIFPVSGRQPAPLPMLSSLSLEAISVCITKQGERLFAFCWTTARLADG